MIILALLAAAALAFRYWTRLQTIDSTVSDLTARVRTLEQWRTSTLPPTVAATPAPVRPATAPVTPRAEPRPTAATAPSPAPSPAPTPAVAAVATTPRPASRATLETRIGSRWLLYVGVIAIVVGVSYFEKLAIDNHWIGETARVLQGAVVGLLLVAGGLQFVRKGYRMYGQIVSGCGIAILYVSTYAAFNFYHLISQPVAFGFMSAVTTMAAWLADRQRSQGLALVAVGGGFATPFLLPASTDAEASLFGYDAFLIAGTMFLSRRRDWPTLNVVSYGFTVLTFFAWAAQFYSSSKYLTTELFLTTFCAMFLYILHEVHHSNHPSARAERAILWTAPFGYYFASLDILWEHSPALLVFFVMLSFLGVIVSTRGGSGMRVAFWIAVADPLLLWSNAHGVSTWIVPGLAAWAGVYVLNLAGLLEATVWKERKFAVADIALLHLNALAAFAGAYRLLDPVYPSVCAPLAAAFALVNGAFGFALARRFRDEALHFAALAFTFVTIAVALQFDGVWITSGWAAEGAVVAWLGLRERREWLRAGGLLLFGISILRLLADEFSAPPLGQLLLVNRRALCGLFVVGLTYGLTLAHERLGSANRRSVETGVGLVLAKLLLLALAAGEIVAYWALHVPPPFEPAAQVIDVSLVTGAVIMWLGLRRQQEWMRAIGGAIVALGAYLLFSIQLQAAPLGYVSVLNGRAAAGIAAVLVLYGLAVIHRRTGGHVAQLAANVALFTTAASLLTLSLLTSEIDAFWAARGAADVWSMAREGLHAIAWGGIGGFLMWHGLSNRRSLIRAIGGALLVVGVARLLRLQFASAGPAYIVVANARMMASIVMIALLYGLAYLYRNAGSVVEARRASGVLWLIANVLTLTLLTTEITAYWHVQDVRYASALASADSHFAREMMLSITWAVYATLLIVVGLRRKYAPIRYFAMTVFVVTIVKVFAIDLAELDRIYRVLSVVGLGVTLLLTSYLYQRTTGEPGEET
jgi:uncharacterized membrane protein